LGFLVALILASLVRHARGRLLLIAAAIAVCAGYSIYVGAFASCPKEGECDKGITIVFLAAGLLGWITGAASSWLLRHPESR
jgi:high-affinity Fe2+/Pb2+ permease